MSSIEIQAFTLPNWDDRRTANIELRIYADSPWISVEGVDYGPSSPPNTEMGNVFVQRITGLTNTPATHELSIPQFLLPSTRDALLNPSVRLFFWIGIAKGSGFEPIAVVPNSENGLTVPPVIASATGCSPSGTCCSFVELVIWNYPDPSPPPPAGYYTKEEIDRIFGTIPGVAAITSLSGDGIAMGPGAAVLTLAPTGVIAGSYTNTNLTVDAKGRITAVASGVGSGVAWGTITGTLSNQTDLQTALNAKQPLDAELSALAGLVSAADRFPYFTGSGTASLATLTGTARTLLDDPDVATMRSTLELGTLATQNGTFSGTSSGTNTGDQTPASLGLVIGTNVQAWDADLDAIAALSGTGFLKRTGTNTWTLDTSTYLTANQTITLTGNVTGSGSTSIATTIAAGVVTNSMLAGSIAISKLSISGTPDGTKFLRDDGAWANVPGGSSDILTSDNTFTGDNIFQNIGIFGATPDANQGIRVVRTFTSTGASGSAGIYVNQTDSGTGTLIGGQFYSTISGAATLPDHPTGIGVLAWAISNNSGRVDVLEGADIVAQHTGSGVVQDAYGAVVQIQKAGAGSLVNAYGLTLRGWTGTATTSYGIYANSDIAIGTTNSYFIYSLSTSPSVFSGSITVPTEAYGPTWNGSNQVPTKDAVYDKIETLSAGALPAGSGTELQYRASGSTFGAVTSSSVSGANVTLGGNLTISTGGLIKNSTGTVLGFFSPSTPVNYVQLSSADAGNGPVISAVGTDSNIYLKIQGKGAYYPWVSTKLLVGDNFITPQSALLHIRDNTNPNPTLLALDHGTDYTGNEGRLDFVQSATIFTRIATYHLSGYGLKFYVNEGLSTPALILDPSRNATVNGNFTLTGTLTAGSGPTTLTGATGSILTAALEGGTASPGSSKYYGTDASGVKGFYSLPPGGTGSPPGGSGTELQYRSNPTTFAAVPSSSVSGSDITLGGSLTVPTEVYGSSWNGSNQVPTKDALYDKIETLSAASGTVTVVSAGSLTSTALVTGGGSQTLQTPSGTTTLDSSGNLIIAASLSFNGTLNAGDVNVADGATAYTFNGPTATLTTNIAVQRFTRFRLPTVDAASAFTVTDAATVQIEGEPLPGGSAIITNAWALRVVSGKVFFGGLLTVNVGTHATGDPGADAIYIPIAAGASNTVIDSNYLRIRATSNDSGTPHTMDWRIGVHVENFAGASAIKFYSQLDGGVITERFRFDDSGNFSVTGDLTVGGLIITDAGLTVNSTSFVLTNLTSAGLDTSTGKILGRRDSNGNVEEISVGSGLTMSAGVLTATGGGSGDVVGPASATDNAIARFDTTTGKLIQNSDATLSDFGLLSTSQIFITRTANDYGAAGNYPKPFLIDATFSSAASSPLCGITLNVPNIASGLGATALRIQYIFSGTSGDSGTIRVTNAQLTHSASGLIVNARAYDASIANNTSGGMTTASLFKGTISNSSSTIGDLRGLSLDNWASTGTVTTSYGIYIDSSIDVGATKYAFYSLSTSPSLFTGPVTVPTEVYGSSWNGSNQVPTKDALYDKIETLTGGSVTVPLVLALDNATTAAVDTVLDIQHSSSGTPAVGFGSAIRFGLESATTVNQDAASISAAWTDAAHSSRSAKLSFSSVSGGGALTERMYIDPVDGFLTFPHVKGVKVSSAGENLILCAGVGGISVSIGNGAINLAGGVIAVTNRGTAIMGTGAVTETGWPALSITGTWNASGVTHDGILLNITNTASAVDSKLLDLQIGSVSQFKVDKIGNVTALGRITPRVTSTASSATPTPNADTTDQYILTALATGATFAAPTGTPVQGQRLLIRIKDNGTGQTLAWNAIYRAIAVTLPTTTVASKTHYVGAIYNSTDSKWDVLAVGAEA